MFIRTTPLLAALLLPCTLAFPYPLPNSTIARNSTICNSTLSLCDANLTATADPPPTTPGKYKCIEIWPADLAVVNSRYPDYDVGRLHQARQFFMLRRQLLGDGEIATRVQFQGLPSNTSNLTCRLEFILPNLQLQLIHGPNPSFDIYQVEREFGSMATWNTYEGQDSTEVFGTVNGEPEALERTRSVSGVAAINETACNQTLSFQMRMKYDSVDMPNYWGFSNVEPPAWPEQGFRVVYGC
ncbi:uncharacterized protein K460DRAFT_332576 [Cucurbitaria berberidis CBS 394.84]|uniref:Ubiquitin 3 binding protein But2 C-terminal domain-containing protein n=1 Tax=Cucurbitaria berberidis CBS 394.84 TaxID=1168544 RepID=A0A9P4GM07_9PLEO|nr:uncharacterized protein K460DRAFT_332576 [Cucurbitaria berberidis CBS 394.84]KAF1847510.1 hypothetical protein K460DRAFT_332576 [Cucurbitaria berberidis CBS 394.84]